MALRRSDLTIHDLRHVTASKLAETADVQHVKAALGHGQIETTLRYVHGAQEAARPAIDEHWEMLRKATASI